MIRSLSKNEAKVVLGLEWAGKTTARIDDVRSALGASDAYARFVAHRLVKKGWLERLRPGLYQLVPADRGLEAAGDMNPLAAGSELVAPYFYSFGTACTHYGFTEQVFQEVYIACLARRRPVVMRGMRYVFAAVQAARFFGFREVSVLGKPVQMATPERTLLDAVDRPNLAGGVGELAHVVGRAASRVSWEALLEEAARFGSAAVVQRLGCLLDVQRAAIPVRIRAGLERLCRPGGRVYLAPVGRWGATGPVSRPWNVVLNLPVAVLEPPSPRTLFKRRTVTRDR